MNNQFFIRLRGLGIWLALLIALLFVPTASAHLTGAGREQQASRDDLPRALIQQAKLTAADGAASDQFGHAVALSNDGNVAVVGAPWKGFIGGAAYVFVRSAGAWSQQQKLTGGTESVNFGFSVATSGDGNTIAIGDPSYILVDINGTHQPGAVLVFTRAGGTWTPQDVLRAAGKTGAISFGTSVALSNDGNTLVIGVGDENSGSPSQGAAYVFTKADSTWYQVARLLASDGAEQDHFGSAVAINGDGSRVVVGVQNDDLVTVNDDRGSAYVFDRPVGGWVGNPTENAKLIASDGGDSNWFGCSVSISSDGNTMAIGARGNHNGTIYEQGAAYSFALSSGAWNQQQKLVASDRGTQSADFGATVAISTDGNTLAAGAPAVSSPDTVCGGVLCQWHGAAYAFARSGGTWSEQQKLTASDKGFDDQAGVVAISGDGGTIILGSERDDVGSNSNQGSAYIFTGRTLYLPLILR